MDIVSVIYCWNLQKKFHNSLKMLSETIKSLNIINSVFICTGNIIYTWQILWNINWQKILRLLTKLQKVINI